MKPSIYLAFSVYNRIVDMDIMAMCFKMMGSGKYKMAMETVSGPYIDSNRNRMAEDFLKSDCEWLYFWDTDVVIEDEDFLLKLIETSQKLNAPVVGAPYMLKGRDHKYVVVRQEDGILINYKEGELIEPLIVQGIGCGSMLIHRSVIEELKSPYFEIIPKAGGLEAPEDYVFCDKVIKLGYQVACDPRVGTYHFAPAAWEHKATK